MLSVKVKEAVQMKGSVSGCFFVSMALSICLSGVFRAEAAVSEPVLVRGCVNERLWQTDFSPDRPLVWRWGGSDSAEITVTNHANGTVSEIVVLRSENGLWGEFDLPDVKDPSGRTADAIFDVGVVLKKEGDPVEAFSARVARVTGAGCDAEPGVVRSLGSQWGFVKSASAVVPYDTGWHTNAAVAEVSFGSARIASGKSGYAPLPMPGGADGIVSLSFDGESYAQSCLVRIVPGMFLIVR